MEKCLICDYECNDVFQHIRNKHGMKNLEYKLKYNLYGNCLLCGEPIKRKDSKFCCEEHGRVWKSREKYKNVSSDNYVVCKICGFYGGDIGSHIRDYHKMTLNEYYVKYSATTKDVYSVNKLKSMSDRVRGNKNPGFHHEGTLSPFSKRFIKYDTISDNEKEKIINEKEKIKGSVAKKNQNSPNQTGYWMKKGFTEEESKQRVSERQRTFTLEKCIEKYGEVEGIKRWSERQGKWLKNLPKLSYSNISQTLFIKIYEMIKDEYQKIYFATLDPKSHTLDENKNHEYMLRLKTSYCKLDFFIKDINKGIEFDGDYWHGEKRGNKDRDEKRDKSIIEQGIMLHHVKERDYKNNPEKTIQECLKFIYG